MNLIGRILANRYEILEEVGSGGMAVVYKAKCQLLNRFVAVKVLRTDLQSDAEFVRRFNVEAQSAASLAHPNIVSIHDVGNEDGLHYIVMEYVEGETLKDYIDKKHVLPWREAVNYAVQIGKGLEQAHKNSIIHRDIKPHNIIMTNDGVLKVTDFGIARANVQSTMTCEDSAIGSVHYISPEQARGGYTDERSDIYSLGIVLYEMLTGVVPFDNESPVTIAIKHLQEQPIPPREHNISIPLSLERIVLKAIAKELSMRYKNVSEMIEDLQAVLNDPTRVINIADEPENTAEKGHTRVMPALKDDEAVELINKKDNKENEEIHMAEKKKNNREEAIDKKKEKKVIIAAIVCAIAVILLIAFGFSSMLGIGGLISSGENIEIPKIEGMTYDDAVEKYKEDGFSIVKGKKVTSNKEEGTILEQEPAAGSKVKKTDDEDIVITVEISAGKSDIKLKNYARYEDRKAEVEIENLGLRVEITEEFSDTYPIGSVIKQDPKAGTLMEKGETVILYISKGPEENEDEGDNSGNGNEGNSNGDTTTVELPSGNNEPTNSGVTNPPVTKKKRTTLTLFGPKDKASAVVQVKVNGKSVHTITLAKGASDEVMLEGTSDTIEVEILYDGVVKQKKTVTLH